jgi:hypothetical protein
MVHAEEMKLNWKQQVNEDNDKNVYVLLFFNYARICLLHFNHAIKKALLYGNLL